MHKSPHRPTNSHVAKTKTTCRSPSARVARGRQLTAGAPTETQQVHLSMPPEVQGSARGGGRGTQAAGAHTQTHNCRDQNDGWRSPPPPHNHPTTRAPSQSSVAVNGPQTTRAVRKVTRLRFARERGAGWGAWRWGRGGNWQLEGANHQAPPNRAGAQAPSQLALLRGLTGYVAAVLGVCEEARCSLQERAPSMPGP